MRHLCRILGAGDINVALQNAKKHLLRYLEAENLRLRAENESLIQKKGIRSLVSVKFSICLIRNLKICMATI